MELVPTTKTIKVRTRSRAEFKGKLRQFTLELLGKKLPSSGPAAYFWSGFAHSLFTSVHDGFMLKSDGGKDDLGYSWKPLAKSTIASRPLVPGERKKLGILGLGKGGRGLLTASQNRVWKGIFASHFHKLLARGVSVQKAKVLAARLAWAILKSRGAKTKLEVLGNRHVPILIVTHELENSLQPGIITEAQYQPSELQVFRVKSGEAIIGTKVKHAKYVHKVRPLWGKRITPWIGKAVTAGRDLAVKHFEAVDR